MQLPAYAQGETFSGEPDVGKSACPVRRGESGSHRKVSPSLLLYCSSVAHWFFAGSTLCCGQLVCGSTMISSACGFGRSPGTYAAKLRARWMDSQAGPVWVRAKYWKLSLTGMAPGGCGT